MQEKSEIKRFFIDLFLRPADYAKHAESKGVRFIRILILVFCVEILLNVFLSWLLNVPLIGLSADNKNNPDYGFLYRLYPWSAPFSVFVFAFFFVFFPSNFHKGIQRDLFLGMICAMQGMLVYALFILVYRVFGFSFEPFSWNYFFLIITVCAFQTHLFYQSVFDRFSIWKLMPVILMVVVMNFVAISVTKTILE